MADEKDGSRAMREFIATLQKTLYSVETLPDGLDHIRAYAGTLHRFGIQEKAPMADMLVLFITTSALEELADCARRGEHFPAWYTMRARLIDRMHETMNRFDEQMAADPDVLDEIKAALDEGATRAEVMERFGDRLRMRGHGH